MNGLLREIPGHLPKRLAISFWMWGFMGVERGNVLENLDLRMAELKARGFNCIRLDSGAGLCHDAAGRPRGPIALHAPFPGQGGAIRQLNYAKGGRIDVLARVIELFEAAKRHNVFIILSSWFYLHTYWLAEEQLCKELLPLSQEERYMRFAKALDWIIAALEERGLHKQIAFAEIFNECDGLDGYGSKEGPEAIARLEKIRKAHEEAIAFLRSRHPCLLFALDTYTPHVNREFMPNNMQVWNLHSYYLWPRSYAPLEGKLITTSTANPESPEELASIRSFLRKDMIPLADIRRSREGLPPAEEGWNRRVWLYSNVDKAALPKLEETLSCAFEKDFEFYKTRAEEGVEHAAKLRDSIFPGLPLVLGEAASYCALDAMRWEERSENYWKILEFTAKLLKKHSFWGSMPRTNSGPEDPCWTECQEQLKHVNEVFLKD